MSHWTEVPEDDQDPGQSFVRPYTITHGRTTSARDDLTLITVIATVARTTEHLAARGLQPEHRLILQQCRRPVALAEVAAQLDLPVAVTKILIADLIDLGCATAAAPLAMAVGAGPDMTLLRAVRDGLLRL